MSALRSPDSADRIRTFFYYYGCKWRDALTYPAPDYDTIIEPFAGAAGYSLHYPNRNIVLCDLDPIISEMWRYLIRVSSNEILSLPDLEPEGCVDDLSIPQEAKWLIGFWLNRGVASPRKRPSKWMRSGIKPNCSWGPQIRQRIATQVGLIRHWQIFNCSYEDLPSFTKATWFVDPPYETMGKHYRMGSSLIDYQALGAWCKSRSGQVIVCENAGATWLPFRGHADVKTSRKGCVSKEVVWLSDGH